MSTAQSYITNWIEGGHTLQIPILFATLYVGYIIVSTIYDVFFGPLSKFPGPKSFAISRIPELWTTAIGKEGETYVALHEKYGPIVRVGPRRLSFASGAQSFKDTYGFAKPGQRRPYKDPMFYTKPINGVHSLIGSDDVTHARQRKILAHAFSDKALKEQEPLLKSWSLLMRKKLEENADGKQSLDLLKYYNCTTFDIMGDLTFSEGLNMLEDSEYSPWVKTIFASLKSATLFRTVRRLNRFAEFIVDNIVFKSPKAREMQIKHFRYSADRVDRRLERGPQHYDFWSVIMKKDVEDGGLSLEELHSTSAVFMIAGTETTATALSGTTYYLLKNPQYLKALTDEVRGAFASFDDITLEKLAKLKYMHAVLQEGLRMYPPVPVGMPRVTPKEGSVICDQYIPSDVGVSVHNLATYRLSTNFKDPYEFRPERWLGDPEYKDDHLDALEPFSVGPRNCIGKNLAWNEMRILLATVLLHFDLKLCEESDNWVDQKVFILWEKKPLMCTLVPAKS